MRNSQGLGKHLKTTVQQDDEGAMIMKATHKNPR